MHFRKDRVPSPELPPLARTPLAGMRQGTRTSHVTDVMVASAKGVLICGQHVPGTVKIRTGGDSPRADCIRAGG